MMLSAVMVVVMTGCFGSKASLASGGEVTGTSGRAFTEPTPHGMTLIKRGHLKMGIDKQDSLWGKQTPIRDISVEGFWMDEHTVFSVSVLLTPTTAAMSRIRLRKTRTVTPCRLI